MALSAESPKGTPNIYNGSFFSKELWFGRGYKIAIPRRGNGCSVYHGGSTHSVGIVIEGFTELTEELRLVNPFVRVHLVNIETGQYVKSNHRNGSHIPTVTTRISSKQEGAVENCWSWKNDQLVFRSTFSEIVSKEHILLFEVLDIKTSLKLTSKDAKDIPNKVKRIAWAFLLPVGGGELQDDPEHVNIGYPASWNTHNADGARSLSRRRSAPSGKENQNTNNTTNRKDATSGGDDIKHAVSGDEATPPADMMTINLQLYSFKADGLIEAAQRSSLGWPAYTHAIPAEYAENDISFPHGMPEVYLQWRRQTYLEIASALKISAGPGSIPAYVDDEVDNEGDGEKHGTEGAGRGEHEGAAGGGEARERNNLKNNTKSGEKKRLQYTRNLSKEAKAAIAKRSRTEIEPCIIPDTLLHTIDIGPSGAMSVSFSHCGVFLATAGESPIALSIDDKIHTTTAAAGKIYALHIFDSDTGRSVWADLRAHHGVVYQIRWSLDDCWMLSCSGDGSCKIWDTAGIKAAVHSKDSKASHHMPQLLHTLEHSPLCFVYCALFQDYSLKAGSSQTLPRVITGTQDGRIRVYQDAVFLGQLGVKETGKSTSNLLQPQLHQQVDSTRVGIVDILGPHTGLVNDLSIDCKSKNLFSGDSTGVILVWRLDVNGWYQILRKLKTEALGLLNISSLSLLSVVSLQRASLASTHSQQMLVLAPPHEMTLFNTSTYKSNGGSFPGLNIPHQGQDAVKGLTRAALSADGRLAICGSTTNTHSHILRVWDASTGSSLQTPLTSLKMPYPIRAIAWHPTQHVIAVSMVGPGAALGIYYAKRASLTKRTDGASSAIVHAAVEDTSTGQPEEEDVDNSTDEPKQTIEPKGSRAARKKDTTPGTPAKVESPRSSSNRMQQARDLMQKMRTITSNTIVGK